MRGQPDRCHRVPCAIPCLVPSVLFLIALWAPVTLVPDGNENDAALVMMMSTMEPLIRRITDSTGDPDT